MWSKATDIEFKDTDDVENAHITIKFSRGEHGDGYENAFDGRYYIENSKP